MSTSALEITAGSLTAVISDDGSCDGNACGSISDVAGLPGWATGSIDGWSIDVFSGASRFEAIAGTCGGPPFVLWPGVDGSAPPFSVGWTGGCSIDALNVVFSVTDVSQKPTGLGGIPAIGLAVSGFGNSEGSFSGYVDAGNSLFNESTLVGTTGPYLGWIGSEPDGTDWFFTGGPPIQYSATIDGMFDSPGWFSTAGIVEAPEPGAIVLLGTALTLCASRLRRRPPVIQIKDSRSGTRSADGSYRTAGWQGRADVEKVGSRRGRI